jgi:hypothetical protein
MAHNYAINDDVHHQLQGPQGRAGVKQRSVYTIVTCLPIEADGRPRYRIKSKTENVERVVTEEQISRLGLIRPRFRLTLTGECPAGSDYRLLFRNGSVNACHSNNRFAC